MNESSCLIPPELKTWQRSRISRKSLFLYLLLLFVRYDEANVRFGRFCYNSVPLLAFGKAGPLLHN
jgi:hypothetical protein